MTDQLYFQWQNDVLRKSIYPLREMKLRDFLVYYKEIDLWAEYKNKNIAGEITAYHAQKKQAVEKAVQAYYEYRNYFLKEDVRADYQKMFNPVDESALTDIHAFHKTFATYLPRVKDPRNETYFVSQQMLYWQQFRKDYLKKVIAKERRVDIMKRQTPPNPNVPKEEKELAALKNVAFKMVDEELSRLYAFVSASSKIEKRKVDIHRSMQAAIKNVDTLTPQLQKIEAQVAEQQALQKRSSDELARLKSPPALAPVESYFSTPDVSVQVRAKYPQASQALLDAINGFHKELKEQLAWSKSDDAKLTVIKNTLYKAVQYQKSVQNEINKQETDLRNMGPTWKYKAEREALRNNLRDVSLKVAAEEVARLTDYQSAFEYGRKSKDELTRLTQAKEQELAKINGSLSQLGRDAKSIQDQIDAYDDLLIVTEDRQLALYIPDPTKPVTVKDIVQLKVEEYKASLEGLDHYQLLELVVKRFREKPDRFPKWLQYMVVHFSGMRYASAHGSWADPKDLLANLQASFLAKDLKKMDDATVEAFCRDEMESYAPSGASTGTTQRKPELAGATEPEWKDRIAGHVKRIKRALEIDSTSYQRSGLLNLRIDEESYRIDHLKPPQVMEELLSFKDELPDWMWKEIIKLTDLRVNQVSDPNWEKLTPAEQAQQYSQQDAEFRKIMDDWKQKFVTGWREEHDKSDQLIVTRAVCNEVAEHIQHLRGHSPWGGLTPKPKWYQSQEAADPGHAYFVKPESGADYKTGASILWLRFVWKEPNEWQLAHPISTKKGGFGLLPPEYIGKRQADPNGTTPWVYDRSDPIKRSRTLVNPNKVRVHQEEWLRWIHEATVVETAETANGTVVLTFETALPSDDPRLSSIGVFKHYLSDLLGDGEEDSYNRSFVGYVPEGQVPVDNLKDMLDWEKILYKTL